MRDSHKQHKNFFSRRLNNSRLFIGALVMVPFVVMIGLVGYRELRGSHAATVPVSGPLVPADGHVLFGASQKGFTELQSLTGRDQAGKRRLEAMRIFYGWNENFNTTSGNLGTALNNGGTTPVISIGGTDQSWADIAAGSQDTGRLTAQKNMLKTINKQFFLTYFHEPTDDVDAAAGRTATSFVAATRHIHDFMMCQNGAGGAGCQPLSNAVWTWIMIPNSAAINFSTANASGWYPGDAYVDWLGADPYLFECPAPTAATPRPQNFTIPGNNTYTGGKNPLAAAAGSRLDAFYNWATNVKSGAGAGNNRTNMPIMLPEWGTNAHYRTNTAGDIDDSGAATWITAAKNDLKNVRPNVKAILYFNSDGSGNARCDHRLVIDGHQNTNMIAAMKAMANDTYFGGNTTTPPPATDNPPSVAVSASPNSVTVGSEAIINASAADDKGVVKVEFIEGGVVLATDTAAPYSFTYATNNAALGDHTITAKAYDTHSPAQTAQANVVVNVHAPTATEPTITGVTPTDGGSAGGTAVTINGNNLGGAKSAAFGGAALTGISSTNTTITGTTAAHNAGRVSVDIVVKAGNASLANGFHYYDNQGPTVPTSVSAAAVTGKVTVSWAASTDVGGNGVAGYEVFRDGSSVALNTSLVAGTSFDDTNVVASHSYSYKVRAVDSSPSANKSGLSAAATATTPASPDKTAPTVPGSLQSTGHTRNNAALQWTASTEAGGSGLGGYHIYRGSASATCSIISLSQVNSTAGTSFTDTTLLPSTTYKFGVTAHDNAGNESGLSNCITVTTDADTVPPGAPTNLVANAPLPATVNLSWAAPSDDAGGSGLAKYRIYRNGTKLADTTNASKPSYTDSTTTPNTDYSYQVSALDVAGNESAKSNAAAIKTPDSSDHEKPSKAGNLQADATDQSISLRWNASTDNVKVIGYHIYRNGTMLPNAVMSGTSYTDTGLTASTAYTYTVEAFDAAANKSDMSDELKTSTLAAVNLDGGKKDVDGTVQLTVPGDNPDLTNVKFFVDGQAVSGDQLNTEELKAGEHTVTCEATNKFGEQVTCDSTTIVVPSHGWWADQSEGVQMAIKIAIPTISLSLGALGTIFHKPLFGMSRKLAKPVLGRVAKIGLLLPFGSLKKVRSAPQIKPNANEDYSHPIEHLRPPTPPPPGQVVQPTKKDK